MLLLYSVADLLIQFTLTPITENSNDLTAYNKSI